MVIPAPAVSGPAGQTPWIEGGAATTVIEQLSVAGVVPALSESVTENCKVPGVAGSAVIVALLPDAVNWAPEAVQEYGGLPPKAPTVREKGAPAVMGPDGQVPEIVRGAMSTVIEQEKDAVLELPESLSVTVNDAGPASVGVPDTVTEFPDDDDRRIHAGPESAQL